MSNMGLSDSVIYGARNFIKINMYTLISDVSPSLLFCAPKDYITSVPSF